MSKNESFESFLFVDRDLKKCMFFVWDGNHKLQAWLLYINYLHNDEPSWHISIDSIIFDTFQGLAELLIAMT
jgi:hypothetical protein